MATPVVWVTASLTTATIIVASLLIATGSRGEDSKPSSASSRINVQTVATGLVKPWSLAFLPGNRMLVTERPGRLRIITADGKISAAVKGVPQVWDSGQGGLLDVITDRAFADNNTIYFCFSEKSGSGGRTAVARAKLNAAGNAEPSDATLSEVNVIFRQDGPLSTGKHYGCRIAQAKDSNLFVTLGEHSISPKEAQNLGNHLGKLIRITPEGKAPADNPFVGRSDAKPEIWSFGHRNGQGLAINPANDDVWEIEHGPRGGDEVNLIGRGNNYGWPVIGYGIDYNGAKIHQSTAQAGMVQPAKYWVPSIAPSGMTFYTGSLFPEWQGSIFTGGLASKSLVRLKLDGKNVSEQERLLVGLGERIRDVRQGPDGALWVLTDGSAGRLLRITPTTKKADKQN